MSPVVELLIEFRRYLRASFAAAPAFFDVSLAQQDQLAIRALKNHHRTIRVKSEDLGFSQHFNNNILSARNILTTTKAIVGQFRHLMGYLISILTGFL